MIKSIPMERQGVHLTWNNTSDGQHCLSFIETVPEGEDMVVIKAESVSKCLDLFNEYINKNKK